MRCSLANFVLFQAEQVGACALCHVGNGSTMNGLKRKGKYYSNCSVRKGWNVDREALERWGSNSQKEKELWNQDKGKTGIEFINSPVLLSATHSCCKSTGQAALSHTATTPTWPNFFLFTQWQDAFFYRVLQLLDTFKFVMKRIECPGFCLEAISLSLKAFLLGL